MQGKFNTIKVLRAQVQEDLRTREIAEGIASSEEQRKIIEDAIRDRMKYMEIPNEQDESFIFNALMDDFFGLGPIQKYMDDPTITEIMVNGHAEAYIERNGKLIHVAGKGCERKALFSDDDAVRRIINRILIPLGRRCDEQSPYVDARLPDGSRVNATIPPISLNGPTICIRKFSEHGMSAQDYVECGAASLQMMAFLNSAVASKCNIVVSGGTGSGKTTLLNTLSAAIDEGERIITIEDSAELKLAQPHVLRREARPANSEGKGAITIHDLVVNSLRERPDRIIVGECRSIEAIEMLQAMNTGHDGSMTTVHANDPLGAIQRIETMVMEKSGLPTRVIRQQIASAIHLIVQTSRYASGARRIEGISAIVGMEGDNITLQPLFVYDAEAKAHKAVGFQPPARIAQQFNIAGYVLDTNWFKKSEEVA